MPNTSKGQLPSHEIFHVSGEGDNAYWTKIGAAWEHGDGNGYNLQLELVPLASNRVVLRKFTPKEERK